MHKIKKYGLLGALLSIGFMTLLGTATAEDKGLQNKNISSTTQDILADDSDDTDAANDFDSNKESESEDAAPTPQEEEDNPLLDEEGNVIKQGQQPSQTLVPQNQMPDQNPLDMLNQNVNADK